MTALTDAFERYTQFDPAVPVYQVTTGERPTIHRFFDSSPISPSGRYIALTEFPFQDRLPAPGDHAMVLVIDLRSGAEIYRSQTGAWDTQVGAQVQWGASDDQLYFNRMDEREWRVYGVRVDPKEKTESRLAGSIYHVSTDGKYAISPDLVKITIAQAGYGVHVPQRFIQPNINTPKDDGIFLTDLRTGASRLLVSLDSIAAVIGRKYFAGGGACYAFHTKWNADASRIMLIMRWFPSGSRRSRNWLITLAADGSDIRVAVNPKQWGDGHHPNWYPFGDRIIMNLPARKGAFAMVANFIGKVGRRLGIARLGVPLRFKRFDADGSNLAPLSSHIGSGHPTIHPSARFLLSDSYLQEPPAYKDGSIPLRLIDLASDALSTVVRIDCKPAFAGPKKELRIDPHPAWHGAGHLLAFNAAVNGVRAVYVADFREHPLCKGSI